MDADARVAQHSIRKSSHGRTQLFVPSQTTVLREIKCLAGARSYDRPSVYHVLHGTKLRGDGDSVTCWHCCDVVSGDAGQIIPIPRAYDAAERCYHVYGNACCPGCAKAYIIEHSSFDRGQQIALLQRMLREVYGVCGTVLETPPRASLQRFGGPFRRTATPRAACQIVEPPFVSYCMIAEEHVAHDEGPRTAGPSSSRVQPEAASEECLEEPLPTGLFREYATRQEEVSDPPMLPPVAAPAPRKRTVAPVAAGDGPMSKFVRNA